MRKFYFMVLLFFIFLTDINALMINDYKSFVNIKKSIKEKEIYKINITAPMLKKIQSDYSDVRVLDKNENEIPFVIISHKYPKEKKETYSFKILHAEKEKGKLTLYLKLPKDHESINSLKLNIDNKDYKKLVVLSKSYNQKNWKKIKQSVIYDFRSEVNVKKTKIYFSKSKASYYKVVIKDLSAGSKTDTQISLKYKDLDFKVNSVSSEKLRIDGILAYTVKKKERSAKFDKLKIEDFVEYKNDENKTIIILEAAVPFKKLSFNIKNLFYSRKIAIYGGNENTPESYEYVASDIVYSFPYLKDKVTKNYIEAKTKKYKYYKFEIDNKNNPPLKIKSITFNWVSQSLFFVGLDNSNKYKLVFESNKLKKPDYDLESFIGQNNWFKLPYKKAAIGKIHTNEKYIAATDLDRQNEIEQNILKIIVVIIIVIMSFWLYRLLVFSKKK